MTEKSWRPKCLGIVGKELCCYIMAVITIFRQIGSAITSHVTNSGIRIF